MPVLPPDVYHPPFLLRNAHLQTVFPAITRTVRGVSYRRERLELDDGDFLDLDWLDRGARRLVALLHGLEGSAASSYMKGMARAFHDAGWDVLAMNFRGCSGEPNRLLRSYHAGATDDLRAVLHHAGKAGRYERIGLVGFSLGGNLLLKYMGEEGRAIASHIVGGVAFSVPCQLASSAEALSTGMNRIYTRNFLHQLRRKMVQKHRQFPGAVNIDGLASVTTFLAFDDRYTAPIHGFRDARAYWRINSCEQYLPAIDAPALIVNALDDPFLGDRCYPREVARRSKTVFLEMPHRGGHVGFIQRNAQRRYWSEMRALKFLSDACECTGFESK